jgi:hypothetical protein
MPSAAGRVELPAETVRYRTQVKEWVYNCYDF